MKTILYILLLTSASALNLQGGEYVAKDTVQVNAGDSLYTDWFAGGRRVDILGHTDGDLRVGGQKISIAGDVTDDVMACCQELFVTGKVGYTVISCFRTLAAMYSLLAAKLQSLNRHISKAI